MKVFLLFSILFFIVVFGQPSQITIGGIFEITLENLATDEIEIAPAETRAIFTGYRLAIEDINTNPDILPDTFVVPEVYDTQGTVAGALTGLVSGDATGLRVMVGPSFSEQSLIAAVASGVYDILLVSHSSSASSLSDSSLYPLFTRAVAPDIFQAEVMIDLILYYFDITHEPNWKKVGIVCTADDYGVGGARNFIDIGLIVGVETVAFQQFLVGATDVSVEVRELDNSGSRVFISYMASSDYQTLVRESKKQEIIGDYYVWICSDGCATDEAFEDSETGELLVRFQTLSLGYMGILPQSGVGPMYDAYLERWQNLDPEIYIGAGPDTKPPIFSLLSYECTIAAALAIQDQFSQGNFAPNGTELFASMLTLNFTTLTGNFQLDEKGDRVPSYQVVNLWPDRKFHKTFTWVNSTQLVNIQPTFWPDGTTRIPDLDVRKQFDYWSCHDREAGTDVTGKLISLETPDGSDINYIEGDYECDQFIDCQNMSDEAYQCTPSLVIAFIIIGILTGIFILMTICILPIICIFGCCVRRTRIVGSGILFLLIMALATIFGSISTYTWYGKPHPVACGFQLWLFGLSALSLACALFARQFRLWRATSGTLLFRKLTKNDEKGVSAPIPSEAEFLIYFILLMIFPVFLIILWTAIATPTADLIEIDDLDHYLCTTGGVTGEPVGLVFFFILVGYCGFLLLGCFLLGFFIRHVPRPFMDKRLMNISVFNITFLSAVVIPVFFVLRYISPFAAWVVRTLGILYGFGSTLYIHMTPKIIGLFLVDRLKQNKGDGPTGPNLRGDGGMDPSMSASNTASVG